MTPQEYERIRMLVIETLSVLGSASPKAILLALTDMQWGHRIHRGDLAVVLNEMLKRDEVAIGDALQPILAEGVIA